MYRHVVTTTVLTVILFSPFLQGRSLMPVVKQEGRDGGSGSNPYLAFRKRTEKMQTRKVSDCMYSVYLIVYTGWNLYIYCGHPINISPSIIQPARLIDPTDSPEHVFGSVLTHHPLHYSHCWSAQGCPLSV